MPSVQAGNPLPIVSASAWYQPAAADFRPFYDRDTTNARREAWGGGNGYWFWVQSFYKGYTKRILGVSVFHQQGWTDTGRQLEGQVRVPAARSALRAAWNKLGRTLAGEWAKDDAVCRINTNDLKRWGDTLREAAARDSGTGHSILAATAAVQAEANRRLAGS